MTDNRNGANNRGGAAGTDGLNVRALHEEAPSLAQRLAAVAPGIFAADGGYDEAALREALAKEAAQAAGQPASKRSEGFALEFVGKNFAQMLARRAPSTLFAPRSSAAATSSADGAATSSALWLRRTPLRSVSATPVSSPDASDFAPRAEELAAATATSSDGAATSSDAICTFRHPGATTTEGAREQANAANAANDHPNVLIKGDNLEALKHLRAAYRERIKLIYIDPPYNTQNKDFAYADSFGFSEEDLLRAGLAPSEAARVKAYSSRGDNSHSAWLAFMLPRLAIAREMLRSDGVIFISIDDNESAQLKLLCDEIFGEENFVAQFLWNKTATPPSLSSKTRTTHEYILCYQKVRDNTKMVARYEFGGDAPLWNEVNSERILEFPANYVDTTLDDGAYLKGERDKIELLDDVLVANGKITNAFRLKGHFRWKQETLDEEIAENVKLIVKSDKFSIRYCREGGREVLPTNEISKKDGVDTNEAATSELKDLFDGQKIFSFNKPVSLVEYLMQIGGVAGGDIVMDFFAGSGTTAHAVLAANARDGGNRRFICAQLGEELDEKKSRAACEFLRTLGREQNIYEITRERILRAARALGVSAELAEYELIAKPQSAAAEEFVLDDGLFASFKAPCELLESFMLADGRALDTPVRWVDLAGYSAAVVGERMYLLREGFGYEQIAALAECEQISGLRAVVAYEGALSSAMHKSLKDHIHVQNNAQSYENAPLKNCEYEVRFL